MDRFFYKHFDGSVPCQIEKEYNKMLRKERYLAERDAEFIVQNANFDTILELYPDPSSLPLYELELEQMSIFRKRLELLPIAMELLRLEYPDGYDLITEYYFPQEKVSLMYLAAKYGITYETARYRMQLAKDKLKEYIVQHEQ